jgi:hypothetical protein
MTKTDMVVSFPWVVLRDGSVMVGRWQKRGRPLIAGSRLHNPLEGFARDG